MKRFFRTLILAVAAGLALFYPLYLGVANWLLRSGELERRLSRRPHRLLVEWDHAWTVFPGVAHVEGLRLRNQTRTVQWWLAIDRGTLETDLLALYDREFVARRIAGTGVSFRLRRRFDAPRRRTRPRPDLEPPIPGLANPPDPAPEEIYPRRRQREPWRIHLAGIDLEGVREIWIEEYRFAGEARAAGGFDLELRQRFELPAAWVQVLSGGVGLGKEAEPILAVAGGRFNGRIEPYSPARHRGWGVLPFLSVQVKADGEVRSLEFLDLYLKKARWLELDASGGRVAADLRLRKGRLVPGSRIEARPERLAVGFLDYRAEGSGRALWELVRDEKARQGRLALNFDEFRIERRGYGRPHVRGRGLTIAAESAEPRLPGLDLFTPVRVRIDLPRADVPDLAFYNAYLPETSGLALTGGSGRMSARFRAAAPDWVGTGEMRLRARGVGASYEGRRLRGDIDLHTRVRRADLRDKRFDISGSRFELTRAMVLDAPPEAGGGGQGWWARVHLDRATLTPGAPVFLRAQAESTLSDPRPVLALLAPEKRGPLLAWLDRLLDVRGVGATAEVALGDRLVVVDPLAIAGGEALLQARLRFVDGVKQGALYASLGRFDVGVEIAGEERDWKLLRPRRWYENYRGF